MWPWRKTETEEPTPSPVTLHDDVVRPERSDWRALGPIQRAIGEPPLVNPVERFSGSLAAWQDPSFLAPLAHIVHADEPSGLIPEIVTPVASPPSPSLPLAVPPPTPRARPSAVQRVVSADAAATPVPETVVAPPQAEPVWSTPLVHARALPVQRSAAVDAGPLGRIEMPPMISLPTLPVAAEVSPPTVVVSGDVTTTLLGDASAADVDPSVSTPDRHDATGDALPLGPTGADAPITTPTLHPDVTVARVADSAPDVHSGPANSMNLPLPSGPTGAARRLGLGEPLAGIPTVQRVSTPSAAPVHDYGGSVGDAGATASHPAAAPTSVTATDAVLPLLTPIQRSVAAPIVTMLDGDRHADPHPSPQTLPHVPEPGPSLQLARLVGDVPPLVTPSPGNSWSAAPPPPPPVQRIAAGTASPTSAPALRTAQLVTEVRGAAPLPYAGSGGSTASSASGVRRAAPVGVPLSALPIATASWVNPAVQRSEFAASPPPDLPPPIMVSRATADAVPAAQTASEPAPASGGDGGHPAAAAGAGGDPEAMVARLFDPLLSRLKSELRLDRERRGSLTDLWH